MKRAALMTLVTLAVCMTSAAQSLEELRVILKANMVGRWEIRPKTNPSIGPMLVYHSETTNTWQGFIGILPFSQDDVGRKKSRIVHVDMHRPHVCSGLYQQHYCTDVMEENQ